jgi:peptidoglycan/xylan/chitin deacetylase (PgdA/CDA1 family)
VTARVVNVLFHGVGKPARELEPGEDGYWITTDRFHAILDEIATWPNVRISFDDGNSSDVEIALPALTERGLTADFFVLAGRLDAAGSLGRDDVRRLREAGMGVGTHGMHHRSWRGLDAATRTAELVTAREHVAELVGEVDAAALPLGQYDRTVLGALRELGYRRVYTSDRRAARPGAWLQPRHSVRRDDTPESFRAGVMGQNQLVRRVRASAVGVIKRYR